MMTRIRVRSRHVNGIECRTPILPQLAHGGASGENDVLKGIARRSRCIAQRGEVFIQRQLHGKDGPGVSFCADLIGARHG